MGVLLLAVVQLGAISIVPALDALLEAEQTGLPVHVESPGSDACPTHHDHAFCQAVRSLSAATVRPVVRTPGAALPVLHVVALGDARGVVGRRHPAAPVGLRAPPLA